MVAPPPPVFITASHTSKLGTVCTRQCKAYTVLQWWPAKPRPGAGPWKSERDYQSQGLLRPFMGGTHLHFLRFSEANLQSLHFFQIFTSSLFRGKSSLSSHFRGKSSLSSFFRGKSSISSFFSNLHFLHFFQIFAKMQQSSLLHFLRFYP